MMEEGHERPRECHQIDLPDWNDRGWRLEGAYQDERRAGFLFLERIVHLGICRAGSYRCGQREIWQHGSIGLSVLLCLWRYSPQDCEYAGFNSHLRKVAQQFPHVEVHPGIWLKIRSPTSASAHLFMKAQQWQQERESRGSDM